MTAVTGALGRRRLTPIRDYAARGGTPLPIPLGLMARPRLDVRLRRSSMVGLALRFVKLCGYLFVALLVLLLALNFRLVYQGQGQFSVQPKDAWAFTGTFVSADEATGTVASSSSSPSSPSPSSASSSSSAAPAVAAVPRSGTLEQGLNECARLRGVLTGAVAAYDARHARAPMMDLDFFTLLSEDLIGEIPNCPAGGEYRMTRDRSGHIEIFCSRHIE